MRKELDEATRTISKDDTLMQFLCYLYFLISNYLTWPGCCKVIIWS